MALVVALTVGELVEEAPVEGANSAMKRSRRGWITCVCCVSSGVLIDIEHSVVKRMPILDQIFEHLDGNAR